MAENKGFNSLLIQQYIEGKLDPKQMHELEREALNDPFLADALEGYAYSNKPVDHQLSILQRQLEDRIALQQANKNYYNFSWQRLSIAAAAGLMFITVGILFWMKSPDIPEVAATSRKADIELTSQAKGEDKIIQQEAIPERTKGKNAASSEVNLASKKTFPVPEAAIAMARISSLSGLSQSPSGESFKGVVTEAGGQPLAGASVQVKGTNIATTTDNKGKFSLPDTAKGVIDVSYLGFQNKEVKMNPGEERTVVLSPNANSLDEVVVTGAMAVANTAQPSAGWPKFQEYLIKNTRYPPLEAKVSGDVIVGFTVNSRGKPENIHIVKSLDALCDREAIRLIKAGPDWKAGADKAAEVRVSINFHP